MTTEEIKKQFELSDEEIRACKARELIIYRPEDVKAYPPDRAIAQAAQKKIVKDLNIYVEQLTKDNNGTHKGNVLIDPVVIAALSYHWQSIRKGLDKEEG